MRKLMFFLIIAAVVVTAATILAGCGDTTSTSTSTTADIQKQLDDIKGALPKFAIPMREVGDRFENMNAAAQGGNWALAAYMSKYMNNAMNPTKVTKPEEYQKWATFYSGPFDPVNNAISAKDLPAFDTAYTATISTCNACHESMG